MIKYLFFLSSLNMRKLSKIIKNKKKLIEWNFHLYRRIKSYIEKRSLVKIEYLKNFDSNKIKIY